MANNIAKKNGKIVKAHLKIDTGMGRHGFLYSEGEKIVKCLKMLNNIEIEGMFSLSGQGRCGILVRNSKCFVQMGG